MLSLQTMSSLLLLLASLLAPASATRQQLLVAPRPRTVEAGSSLVLPCKVTRYLYIYNILQYQSYLHYL